MKYLKKYNEELKSSTYLSAADILDKLGHKRRPQELKDWAEQVKIRELEEKTKRRIKSIHLN